MSIDDIKQNVTETAKSFPFVKTVRLLDETDSAVKYRLDGIVAVGAGTSILSKTPMSTIFRRMGANPFHYKIFSVRLKRY